MPRSRQEPCRCARKAAGNGHFPYPGLELLHSAGLHIPVPAEIEDVPSALELHPWNKQLAYVPGQIKNSQYISGSFLLFLLAEYFPKECELGPAEFEPGGCRSVRHSWTV